MTLREKLSNMKKMGYFTVAGILLSSCTIYQNIPDDDGIYARPKKRTQVVVVERNTQDNPVVVRTSRSVDTRANNDVFSKEVQRLDQLNNSDILTDIDYYSSNDTIFLDDNGNNSRPGWGENNDEVVVNINVMPNNFGWGAWDPWLWNGWGPRWGWNNWGWNNWGWNAWGPNWGWNNWGWNNWGWNAWGPNWGWNAWGPGWGIAGNWGWNNRFLRGRYWRGNRFGFNNGINQFRYGRRVAYNNTNRNNRRGFNTGNLGLRNRRGNTNFRLNDRSRSRNTNARSTNNTNRRRTINNSNRRSNGRSINNSSRRSSTNRSARPNSRSSRSSINRGSSRSSSRSFSRGSSRSSTRGTSRSSSRGRRG